jgi:hypothetical protein
LVPKAIVRREASYDVDEYYRHYLLTHLQQVELDANSELVQLLKNGGRKVSKKSLIAKYGQGKRTIVRETRRHPSVLERYRSDKSLLPNPPLSHEDFAAIEGTPNADWDRLLADATSLPTGNDAATQFERAVEALLTALFYPGLTNPVTQRAIHEGRKRIDITYANAANEGFFKWLAQHYPAAYVFVECKNYGADVGNPELDQLSGRFSPSRGMFGILMCRAFADKGLFLKRCRDTAQDHRGFVIPLDDGDLRTLVEAREQQFTFFRLPLLRETFEHLIM